MLRFSGILRLSCYVVLLAFVFSSCSDAQFVPINGDVSPKPGDLHQVTLHDGRVFKTKDLVIKKDSILFTSSGTAYNFPTSDVHHIERIEDHKVVGLVLLGLLVVVVASVASLGSQN